MPGVVITLTNDVQGWVAQTFARQIERADAELDEALLLALQRRSGPTTVSREANVVGDSTRHYSMTTKVRLSGERFGLFRTVRSHAAAIYACHAAFGEIARGQPDWSQVAVVADQQIWAAPDLTLLGQEATHLLDMSRSPDATLARLAEAA